MGRNRMVMGCFAMATLATMACRSGYNASDDATARATRDTERPAQPPSEGQCAAKLILLEVGEMDDAAAQRIEATLAERFGQGIISARAEPSTRLLTVLARADSAATVATAIDLVGTLGLHAHEASKEAYDEAVAEIGSGAQSTPATSHDASLAEGAHLHSPLHSLEDSLTPLRARFNEGKGRLRFITLLSPT